MCVMKTYPVSLIWRVPLALVSAAFLGGVCGLVVPVLGVIVGAVLGAWIVLDPRFEERRLWHLDPGGPQAAAPAPDAEDYEHLRPNWKARIEAQMRASGVTERTLDFGDAPTRLLWPGER